MKIDHKRFCEVSVDSQHCLPGLKEIFLLCEACSQKRWIFWCSFFFFVFYFLPKSHAYRSRGAFERLLILIGYKDGLVRLKGSLRDSLTPWYNSLPFPIQGIRRFNVPAAVIRTPFILPQPGNWSRLKESCFALQPGMLSRVMTDECSHFAGMLLIVHMCVCVRCTNINVQCVPESFSTCCLSQCAYISSRYHVDKHVFAHRHPPHPSPWALTWQLTSKMTLPITFPSWLRPGSWAALAAVRHRVACSEASDVLAFALSLWQQLTDNGCQPDSLLPSFPVAWVPNVIITTRRDVIIFSPWNMEALAAKVAGVHWHSAFCEWQDIIAAVATMVQAHQRP